MDKKKFKDGFLCGVDNKEILSHEEKQRVTDLADDLISCQLMELPNDGNYRKVVSEVQKHHHTKSCRKYNGQCRYGFPKLPSRKTILAQPLPITIKASDNEEQKMAEEKKEKKS